MSIVDYMIYNSYVVNTDFVNWNSAWWRGRASQGSKKKWRYWMWDMDNVYDLGENFSGVPTTGMTADPCAYETTFAGAGPNQGHPDMVKKLMTNPLNTIAVFRLCGDLAAMCRSLAQKPLFT